MPPKKTSKKQKIVKKNVTFTKKKNEVLEVNTNISAQMNENNRDDTELQKDTEIEDSEMVNDTQDDVQDDAQDDVQDDVDEDHELDDGDDAIDDGHDHELDDVINDDILEDDLYDSGTKPKSVKKKKKVKVDEEEKEEIDDDLCEYNYDEIYDEKKEEPILVVENDKRITLPKLTKYERVRLIGTRAKQISLGAKVMVKNTKGLNPIEIAKLELEFKMIPMRIKRVLPNNNVEIWKLSELEQ